MQNHSSRAGASFLARLHFVGGAVVDSEIEIGESLQGGRPNGVLGRWKESLLRAARSARTNSGVGAAL
jgi:hypothetical protein